MSKQDLEIQILTVKMKETRDRGKQRETYIMSIIKLMVEQSLGEMNKRQLIKWYKGPGDVERYDRQHTEWTRHIKEEDKLLLSKFYMIFT